MTLHQRFANATYLVNLVATQMILLFFPPQGLILYF